MILGNYFEWFPDVPFPKTFVSQCKKILTRLFRVFVHVYIHHFDRLVAIGAEAHVNTCYKHFYYFVRQFDLVSERELEPLEEMTAHICKDPPLDHPSSSPSRFNRWFLKYENLSVNILLCAHPKLNLLTPSYKLNLITFKNHTLILAFILFGLLL